MPDTLFEVTGQIVVVSGGSRGIGQAIARGFAARGASVIATGRDAATLEELAADVQLQGGTIYPCVCDVADPQAISRRVKEVAEQWGRIDTLINVAGVNRRKPAESLTEEDYDFIIDINLKGAFLMSQEVGRVMLERGAGCQINIASINSDRPLKNVLPYAVSKAGIVQMTKALALEWGPRGVRVNAIAPGFILTDLTRKLWADETMQGWGMTNTPLRRLGQPDDLVGSAIFLASPAASFITGQTLYVDGGFTAGWNWPMPE